MKNSRSGDGHFEFKCDERWPFNPSEKSIVELKRLKALNKELQDTAQLADRHPIIGYSFPLHKK